MRGTLSQEEEAVRRSSLGGAAAAAWLRRVLSGCARIWVLRCMDVQGAWSTGLQGYRVPLGALTGRGPFRQGEAGPA